MLFGGAVRTRVVVVLAAVLAMSSADAATVGAAATQLRRSLHIDNTDIGLLVTASSLVAAAASLPFGVLADRVKRTRTLGLSVVLWGVAMLASAFATSFAELLVARLFLGVVTASAGPVVASMIGDYFPSGERGRIYSYILTGELVGAGIGFAVTGDVAALSWRAAFVLLALPTFFLARLLFRLPEPARGGLRPLRRQDDPWPPENTAAFGARPGDAGEGTGPDVATDGLSTAHETDAQRVARERGVEADPDRVLRRDPRSMGIIAAARYVLSIRTNVILIIASACGYFYLAGLTTFGSEFTSEQYGIPTALANVLILVIGIGAIVGVLVGGGVSDYLLKRRYLNSRILVSGIAALITAILFIPAITTRSTVTALPYLTLAGFALMAQNPPIDAARLDIVPPLLWGRAEGIRTLLRTAAQSLAPVLFGAVADLLGGKRSGLQLTFLVMLAPLLANGVILLFALRYYPRDVATAAAAAPPEPQ